MGCYYRDDNYVRYHGCVTFQAVMNYQIPPEADFLHRLIIQDNRIYMEGLTEFPVYTEDIVGQANNCLANFGFLCRTWIISSSIRTSDRNIYAVPTAPDVRSPIFSMTVFTLTVPLHQTYGQLHDPGCIPVTNL